MEQTKKKQEESKKDKHILTIILVIIILFLLFGVATPLFISFLTNRGASNDVELIRNLNTALRTDKNEHRNMTEALDTAENAGYIVSRINATKTNNEILWDSKNDAFVYLDNDKKAIEYVGDLVKKEDQLVLTKEIDQPYLWSITDKVPEYNFSMYWTGKEADIPETIHTGFDSGKTEITRSIHYVNSSQNAQNVVIRTNSFESSLTVDAPLDVVKHFDAAKTVEVKNIALDSYYEYGEVGLVSVSTGHIVIDPESDIDGIHFQAEDKSGDGIDDAFRKIVIEVPVGSKAPTFYRDAVEIDPAGTLVCEVRQGNENEFIWLTKQGVYEQIQISDTQESERSWVSTSDANDLTKKVSVDIANALHEEATVNEETRDIVPPAGMEPEECVEEEGKTVEETEQIIDANKNVKAIVSERSVSGDDIFDLYINRSFSERALVDKAYSFKAFSEADSLYVDLFLTAEENGKKIFTNDIADFSNEEKIAKALAAVERENGLEAREIVESLLKSKTPYFNYLVDFEVSFSQDIEAGSVALGGYYASFADNFNSGNWIGFGISDFDAGMNPIDLKANKPVRLMKTAYEYTHNPDFRMNFAAILGYVKQFDCGYANLSDANEGVVLTVKLNIYEVDAEGNETGTVLECGRYTETLDKVSAVNRSLANQ